MKVLQLHLWLHDKAGKWCEPEVLSRSGEPVRGKRIVIEPSGNSIVQLKLDVAKELSKWLHPTRIQPMNKWLTPGNKVESYYVVLVAEREDGSPAYRTIVPKTVVR